jgi:hypothetical protein
MTRDAYNDFLKLHEELIQMQPVILGINDCWIFIWGQQKYASSRFYQYQFRALQPHKSILWIWKTKCVSKIKFFAWLLLNDRLNTKNMLRRRNKFLEKGYNCALCQDTIEETLEHLFFECPSTVSRWFALGITWEENVNIHQKLYIAKEAFLQPFFMEIFMISAWCVWNERNDFIFNGKNPNLATWKSAFKKEVNAHLVKIKPSLHHVVMLWLDAL